MNLWTRMGLWLLDHKPWLMIGVGALAIATRALLSWQATRNARYLRRIEQAGGALARDPDER
jgi:hypothetical protein